MTRPLALNMHSAQKWAAVVSGTVWKTWGLSPSGTLEAKATRGPLIIWAKPTPGEGGEAVKLEAPKPSPLDLRVMVLNTSAHFERFRRAARGKVRASVRWKTGRRVRRAQVGKCLAVAAIHAYRHAVSLKAFSKVIEEEFLGPEASIDKARPITAKDIKGIQKALFEREKQVQDLASTLRGSAGTGQKQDRQYWEAERLCGRLRKIAPAHWEEGPEGLSLGYDEKRVRDLEEARQVIRRGQPVAAFIWAKRESLEGALLAYLTAWGDLEALRLLLPYLDGRGHKEAYLKALTRLLQRAAYLAHVRRTVKPSPRRGRLPRPVYARPRPPSAPLAPPVA